MRDYQLAKTTTLFHREPSMKLCHKVPCTAVENLTLATPALQFKLHAHPVGEGTIFAKTTTLSPTSLKKTWNVLLCIPKGNGGNAGGMTLRYRKQMGQTTLKTCGGTGAQPAQNGKGGKGETFLLFVCLFVCFFSVKFHATVAYVTVMWSWRREIVLLLSNC